MKKGKWRKVRSLGYWVNFAFLSIFFLLFLIFFLLLTSHQGSALKLISFVYFIFCIGVIIYILASR